VCKPQFKPPTLHSTDQETRSLQPVSESQTPEGLQLCAAHGFAQGDYFQQTPLFIAETDKATLDQFHQPPRRRQRSGQTPNPNIVSKGTVLKCTQHELTQVEDISLASGSEPVNRRSVDRTTQNRHKQPADVLDAKTRNVKPLDVIVFPKPYHGLRRRCAGPDGGDHKRRPGESHLSKQRRRGVVQKVGVVSHEHKPSTASQCKHTINAPAEQILNAARSPSIEIWK
jgi:hypothetical protein